MISLEAAGLSETEAKCYTALLEMDEAKPSELAKVVNETRTNCYKILDKLTARKLVERLEKGTVLRYRATNPTRLLELARERRVMLEQNERELELQVQTLLSDYAKTHEQPGVRYFVGKDEIEEIYADQVKVGKPIHFMHTIAGIDYYTYEHMHYLRMMAVNAGIERYALTPDTHLAHANYKETDKGFLLKRTWMQEHDYTAPVEWGTYGDKMYIISFGEDAMGMTIDSKQIAAAFTQVFKLVERGQRAHDWYAELPRLARKHVRA